MTSGNGERGKPVGRRRYLRAAGALSALAPFAGCADDSMGVMGGGSGDERPLRIGASLPYTGFMAEEGAEMFLGMDFWRERVNRNGGLLGRPVEFVVYDDGSTEAGAATAYERLLDEDGVDLVMGTAGTLATTGAIGVLESKGMPCVFPMSWGPRAWDIDRSWCVPLLPIAGEVPRGLVAVLDGLGMETFAVVRSSSGYARDLTEGLKRHLGNAGIEVLDDVIYERGNEAERREALRTVADLDADVVGGGGSVAAVKPLIRAVNSMDIDAKAFAWFDFDDTRLFPLTAAAEGMLGPGLWAARADYPGNEEFVAEFSEWASRRKPNWSRVRLLQHHSPAAYAGALLLQRAVENAGSVEPKAVRDALWALDTGTPCGRFRVDDAGYQVGKEMLVLQYQRRMREIVWPERLRTAEPRLPTIRRV